MARRLALLVVASLGCGGGSDARDAATSLDLAGQAADASTAGADLAGADLAAADLAGAPTMSFFVTSTGKGMGGDLRLDGAATDGLSGADELCRSRAAAVSAALGAKTWRAYLSTATIDARDRIGAGPWRNQKGVIVANSVAELHEEGGLTNAITKATSLDELGNTVAGSGDANNVHDILTGSGADGRVLAGGHCNNWTSSATTGVAARVGHSDRMGGGSTSWNSVHNSGGCGESGSGSVRTGGGRGSLYCFALP